MVFLKVGWVTEIAMADMMDTEALSPWEVCAMCHGVSGVSAMSRFPNLAGQKQEYIVRQVEWFAKGYRINDGGQMRSTAENLSTDNLRQAALYFSKRPKIKAANIDDFSDAERKAFSEGEKLYGLGGAGVEACAICHDDERSDAPWLYGQHKNYLIKQINEFARHERYSKTVPKKNYNSHSMLNKLNDEARYSIAFFLSKSARDKKEPYTLGVNVGEY